MLTLCQELSRALHSPLADGGLSQNQGVPGSPVPTCAPQGGHGLSSPHGSPTDQPPESPAPTLVECCFQAKPLIQKGDVGPHTRVALWSRGHVWAAGPGGQPARPLCTRQCHGLTKRAHAHGSPRRPQHPVSHTDTEPSGHRRPCSPGESGLPPPTTMVVLGSLPASSLTAISSSGCPKVK